MGSLFVTSELAKGPLWKPTSGLHYLITLGTLCSAMHAPCLHQWNLGMNQVNLSSPRGPFQSSQVPQRKHFVSIPKSKQNWSFHDHAPCSHLVLGRKKWVCGSPGPGKLSSLCLLSLAGHTLSLEPTQASAWVDPPPTCSLCWKAPT